MSELSTPLASCPDCHGFLPPQSVGCPHCDAGVAPAERSTWMSRVRRALLGFAWGSIIATTLMACYGAVYGPSVNNQCNPDRVWVEGHRDKDGRWIEGHCAEPPSSGLHDGEVSRRLGIALPPATALDRDG